VFVSIESDTAAIEAANMLTGIEQFYLDRGAKGPDPAVSRTVYADSTTPKLHAELNGRTVWKVTYEGFERIMNAVCDDCRPDIPSQVCDVWVDSLSGRLLRVNIHPAIGQDALREPTEEELAEDIGFEAGEFVGLPDVKPKIGMLSALGKCKRFPAYADQTVIQYVLMHKAGVTTPSWIIQMRGAGYSKTPYGLPGNVPLITSSLLIMDAISGQAGPLATIKRPVPAEEN
jgi:hypothetical protein